MSTPDTHYSSASLISSELTRRGFDVSELRLPNRWLHFESPDKTYTWLTPRAFVNYPFVAASAKQISSNKQQAYNFVTNYGVSIPKTLSLPADADTITEFLKKYAPLVVKPFDGSGSGGVTLGVASADDLQRAMAHASTYAHVILLQQQVVGHEVRFTVIDNEVVSVILRQTARVVGDGSSNITELINQENSRRSADAHDYLSYPSLGPDIIPEHFLDDARVPAAGEIVEFNKSTLVRGGASLYNVTDNVHHSYKDIALKLASQLNPEFLVVDLMIKDLDAPLTNDNYAFIEFNTAPALKMYYAVRDGKTFDIVTKLVDKIEKYGEKT